MACVGAGLLAIAGATHAAGPTNEELKKQIEELQAVAQGLQKQIQSQSANQNNAPQAPLPGCQADVATRNDLEGLRTDLENYKYEQKRNRDTKTALTTRGFRRARCTHPQPPAARAAAYLGTGRHYDDPGHA